MRDKARIAIVAIGLALAAPACAAPQDVGQLPAVTQAVQTEQASPTIAMGGAGLRTTDLERTVRFYRDGLGLIEVARFQTTDMDEAIMGFGPGSTSPPIFLLRQAPPAPFS